MAKNWYPTFFRAARLELHQIVLCQIKGTCWGGLTFCAYPFLYLSLWLGACLKIPAAQSAGAVEYIDYTSAEGLHLPPTSVQDMTLNKFGSSNARALGNTEHPFIAIAPRSTLARRGST